MKNHTVAEIKKIIIKVLKEHKAIDVVALDIKKLTNIADYMIICTANSTTHVKTLSEKIREELARINIKPIGVEGENTREWMLTDFGRIIVHVMLKAVRESYSLEKLWGTNKIKKRRKSH